MSRAKKVNQLIERFGRLGLFCRIESPDEDARQENSLHHDDVVKSLAEPLVVQRFRVGLDGRKDGSVGPRLMAEE